MKQVKPYQVHLDNGTIVFVNGFRARNLKGFMWLWVHLFDIIRGVKSSEGVLECLPAVVSPIQVVMVSYWRDRQALASYVKGKGHQRLMRYFYRNANALDLFNETYEPLRSGLYHGQPMGMAKAFRRRDQ